MQAVISGRSRVALLLEGEQVRSLHVDSGEIVGRRDREIPYLLGDASDLQFLEDVEIPEVTHRLEVATAQADALHLALMLLDPQLPPEVRRDSADELAGLLELAGVHEYVEGVLLAHPLPMEADLPGALSCCPGRAASSRDLLLRVQALQSEVQDVFFAWEYIPDRVFEGQRNRAFALATAMREGFFRKLVMGRAERWPVDELLIEALGGSTFSQVRNHREILRRWLEPLRESKPAVPLHVAFDRRDQFVAEIGEDAPLRVRGVRGILDQVERQKAAIVEEMRQRRFNRVERFVSDLIDFQLRSGDPVHVCKSLCDLAMKAKAMGFHRLQLDLTRRAIELKPDHGWSWAQHGDSLLRNGELADALEAYDHALAYQAGPETRKTRSGRAEVLKAQNRLPEALSAYESVIEDFPEDVVARTGRAEVLKAQNRLSEALSAYESVIENFPENVVARTGWAEVLKAQNLLTEALSAYESVIEDFPEEVIARNGRAEVLKAQNRLSEALSAYESAIEDFPEDVVARCGRAEVLKAQNLLPEALSAYESAIEDFPEDVVARCGRAEVLKAQNLLPEALSAYESVIEDFPEDVVARCGRAEVLKAQNLLPEALSAYESVIEDFPENVVARNGRACVLAALDRSEEALAILPADWPTTEEDWIGYHVRGTVLLRIGRVEEATSIFKRGMENNPRPASRDYFRTAFAISCLRAQAYSMATSVLSEVSNPRLEKQAAILRFHAFGAEGDLNRAALEEQALKPVATLPRFREIREELRGRYLDHKGPRQSDAWLIREEIDLLLAA